MSDVSHLLQFFKYDHLPRDVQAYSKPFCELAHEMAKYLPNNFSRTFAICRLLEAKDAAVRAYLSKTETMKDPP